MGISWADGVTLSYPGSMGQMAIGYLLLQQRLMTTQNEGRTSFLFIAFIKVWWLSLREDFNDDLTMPRNVLLFPDEGFTKAVITKPTPETPLGISCRNTSPDHWRIVITNLHPDGLLAQTTNLRAGQTILGVNGHLTRDMKSYRELTTLLKSLTTPRICLMTTNSLVATVYKETADSKVGIAFCQSRASSRNSNDKENKDGTNDNDDRTSRSEDDVWIFLVTKDGLFDKTGLLHVGMRVLAINDQPVPKSLDEASRMIQQAVGYLSLLAIDDGVPPFSVPHPNPSTNKERIVESPSKSTSSLKNDRALIFGTVRQDSPLKQRSLR